MKKQGPELESLLNHLRHAPSAILGTPQKKKNDGGVHTASVFSDTLASLGLPRLVAADYARGVFGKQRLQEARRLVQLTCWLLQHPAFELKATAKETLLELCDEDLVRLAGLVKAPQFVESAERAEELSRRVLSAVGQRPRGETVSQAKARLQALDSIELSRVASETAAAQARAAAVRRAMAARAERTAPTYGRE